MASSSGESQDDAPLDRFGYPVPVSPTVLRVRRFKPRQIGETENLVEPRRRDARRIMP